MSETSKRVLLTELVAPTYVSPWATSTELTLAREVEALEAEVARLRGLRFVCDGPPGPEAGRFIELEDAEGNSVSIGEWSERADGFWEMLIFSAQDKEPSDE